MHKPLYIDSIGLSFPGKLCFNDFSATIHHGSRIALIGQNGTGKTSLLKMLNGTLKPTQGTLVLPENIAISYVPQQINQDRRSGAERFNAALTIALARNPDILLLDEPTNHLDASMKRSLLRLLSSFEGTLIISSHDEGLLRTIPTEFWHIHEKIIHVSSSSYNTLINEQRQGHATIVAQIKHLNKDQNRQRKIAQQEQRSHARRRAAHKNENDRCLRTLRKEHASRSLGTSQGKRNQKKRMLTKELQELQIHEVIKPTFTIHAPKKSKKFCITIYEGTCGYTTPLLKSINLTINTGERIAIIGPNASGKTTLLKALMNNPSITRTGTWSTPEAKDIGYLDQHYKTLVGKHSVLATIEDCTPGWSYHERRKLLSTFLFRNNEEVEKQVVHLSGGEKARLSLACIAAKNPPLLIVDEVTNNLDRETKDHVLQVLNAYTGTLIVASHDETFLEQLIVTLSIDCRDLK